jgi:two-component system chemotaxis sensor kinase CheA
VNDQDNPAITFLQEADNLLAEIETAALGINSQASNIETVNHIFRAFHTIKGSGSMFGFDQVAGFTHHMESLIDKVSEGIVTV